MKFRLLVARIIIILFLEHNIFTITLALLNKNRSRDAQSHTRDRHYLATCVNVVRTLLGRSTDMRRPEIQGCDRMLSLDPGRTPQ